MKYSEIEMTHETEARHLPSMAEIRFDCFVTMYEMGVRTYKRDVGLFIKEERSLPPQWFKSINKITLDAIRHSNPYELGKLLKDMIEQMDSHIDRYKKQ